MKKKSISIIIPTLNEEKNIKVLLDSLKNQTFKNFEIIVSDTYSKDNTVKIAKKYNTKIVLTRKKGPAAGRNEGVKKARGNILVFLDADVFVTKNYLFRIMNLFPNKEIIGGVCSFYPNEGNIFYKFMFKLGNLWSKLSIKTKIPYAPTFCLFIRKDVYKKINGFREDLVYCEDNDLVIRAKKYGRFVYLFNPVCVSLRRFKKRGHFLTFFEYIVPTIHYFLKNEVPSTKFKLEIVR